MIKLEMKSQEFTLEDVEFLVNLEELECAASTPTFFLCFPVIYILKNSRCSLIVAKKLRKLIDLSYSFIL